MKRVNELRDEIHENAVKNRFYDIDNKIDKLEQVEDVTLFRQAVFAQRISKIHSEISNAADIYGDAIDDYIGIQMFDDYILDGYPFKEAYEMTIIRSTCSFLSDAIIRILEIFGHLDIDVEKYIELRMKYNESMNCKND
jgi:hypothetical protein